MLVRVTVSRDQERKSADLREEIGRAGTAGDGDGEMDRLWEFYNLRYAT